VYDNRSDDNGSGGDDNGGGGGGVIDIYRECVEVLGSYWSKKLIWTERVTSVNE
jgi:hypothetical protein